MGWAYRAWRCRRRGVRDLPQGRERGYCPCMDMSETRAGQGTVPQNKPFIWRYIREVLG